MFRLPLIWLYAAVVLLAGCSSSSESSASDDRPGMLGRMWTSTKKLSPFRDDLEPREMRTRAPLDLKTLRASALVEPPAPKLPEQRRITVTLRIANQGKRMAQLEFSTTQRIEAVIKNQSGKIVERWSEDQRFEKEPGVVTINPGERVEYTAVVSTRELVANEAATIEVWLPRYESLRATVSIVPVP
jgi:hypothetical protein